MELWSEEDFEKASANTKISDRTLEACRDVLCHGYLGVEAAARHNMLPAQVSRGVSNLRERLAQLQANSEEQISKNQTLRAAAVSLAREMSRQKLVETPAQAGMTYEGKILVKLDTVIVQRQGGYAIVHDPAHLDAEPAVNEYFSIKYPKNGNLAKVKSIDEQAVEILKSLEKPGRGR